MQTGVVLLGHGSRSSHDDANLPLVEMAGEVRRRLGDSIVEAAFMNPKSKRPGLYEALEAVVARGARRVVVVPVFLTYGIHLKEDIPAELARVRARYSQTEILLSNHLGNDPRLLEIVLDRIRAIGTADQGSSILKP